MRRPNLLSDDYYNWLLDFIEDGKHYLEGYSQVLDQMYHTEFISMIANDDNRVADGLDLRNKFAEKVGEHLFYVLEDVPSFCSVLEMMIALAIRLEDNVLFDPVEGDRTAKWFWIMADNLGVTEYSDDVYDAKNVEKILTTFVTRSYSKSGQGGLFPVKMTTFDMKNVEIWYQANYFFREYFRSKSAF